MANLGKCVDYLSPDGKKDGYKITEIVHHALGDRYKVKSNFGAGPETDFIRPDFVRNIYDCPAQANGNVEMAMGGRRRRRRHSSRRKTTRKPTRKHRKSSRKTRRS